VVNHAINNPPSYLALRIIYDMYASMQCLVMLIVDIKVYKHNMK
jgi:hypothetical protein